MRPAEDIKQMIRRWNDRTSAQMDEQVLGDIGQALEQSQTQAAAAGPHKRRIIMRNPIARLSVAAAVVAAVVLGLFEFIDIGNSSGVVWAEVARKVQASRGVIFRTVRHDTPAPYDGGVDFTMNHYSSTQARLDGYVGGGVLKTIYDDCNTKTVILVDHGHKSYVKMTLEQMMPDRFRMADPNRMVERFLSCEHRELGQQSIDGMLCEGIETTDPALHGGDHPPESVTARIWVSVETGYPVQIEGEYIRDNGERRVDVIQDQFQWDVELDDALFEPNIPDDYIDISPDES